MRPHAVTSVSGTVQSDPVDPSGQTIYINPGTQQVPFYEVTTGSEASTRVYVSFAGKVVSQVRTTIASGVMQYHLMTDSQGSIISEGAYGTVTQDMAYDAWGKTRDPDAGSDYGLPPEGGWAWHNERLYTGHESHQDQYVINMNGRLYDPVLSRMLSADPFVPGAGNNPQGLNRYAYVFNNPLRYTDPDGFKPFWKQRWFRTAVAVAVAAYTGYAAGQWMTGYANLYGTTAFATGSSMTTAATMTTAGYAAAGAAGGFMGGLIASGGNLEAAFSGAATGAAFGWAGSLGSTGEIMTGHAAAGCLSGVVQGGGCGRGAASAVVGKAVTLGVGDSMGYSGKFVAATVAGGISSKVAGGHFGTGAQTAAFGYLFNHCAQVQGGCAQALKDAASMTVDWALGSGASARVFGPGSIQVIDMMDAPGVNDARDFFYNKNASAIASGNALQSVTNYSGTFGVAEFAEASYPFSPTRHFIGSYRTDVFSVNGGADVLFVLNNNSSFKSFGYGVAPAWERSTFGPAGNMRQSYWWIEPRRP